jgi:hypothetical protein
MNIKSKIALIMVAFFTNNSAFASAESYENSFKSQVRSPLGCKNVGYQFNLNTVSFLPESVGERQSLYFVYNKLPKTINLYQMLKSSSTRNTYLNHSILGNKWTVFATGEPNLKFICTASDGKSKYGKIVDCSKNLKICEYTRVKFGLNNRGNYWLSNGTSRGSAVGEVVRYGIIPR